MIRMFISLFFGLFVLVAQADISAGDIASNTNDFLEVITSIIYVLLYVAAMGVFVSASMKYRIHRQNPQQIPLSTPVTELVLALVLAAVPTVSKLTNWHLFKEEPNLIGSQATPHGPSGVYEAPKYPPPPPPPHRQ